MFESDGLIDSLTQSWVSSEMSHLVHLWVKSVWSEQFSHEFRPVRMVGEQKEIVKGGVMLSADTGQIIS